MSRTNWIEESREEINRYFNSSQLVQGSEQVLFSPTKAFRVETSIYQQTKPGVNWQVLKVDIIEQVEGRTLFSFFSNHRYFIHYWLTLREIDYLICAEDIYGGQTIIDLTNETMASYAPSGDGFIATAYYPSPDKSMLGIVGCVWACPYVLKIVKTDTLLDLPLAEIKETEINDHLVNQLVWLDNETIGFRDKEGRITHTIHVFR